MHHPVGRLLLPGFCNMTLPSELLWISLLVSIYLILLNSLFHCCQIWCSRNSFELWNHATRMFPSRGVGSHGPPFGWILQVLWLCRTVDLWYRIRCLSDIQSNCSLSCNKYFLTYCEIHVLELNDRTFSSSTCILQYVVLPFIPVKRILSKCWQV